MHAYIITGGTKLQRTKEIENKQKEFGANNFDTITVRSDGQSIGIAQIRDFQKSLNLAPTSSLVELGIINDAELLTVEAQQALLKTLEEPPPKAKIILEVINLSLLLPTIISRCQIISLVSSNPYSQEDLLKCFKILEQLSKVSNGERLKIIEGIIKTRVDAENWIDLAISTVHESIILAYGVSPNNNLSDKIYAETSRSTGDKQPNHVEINYLYLLHLLIKAQQQLSANVNPKLVIENLFI